MLLSGKPDHHKEAKGYYIFEAKGFGTEMSSRPLLQEGPEPIGYNFINRPCPSAAILLGGYGPA